MKRRHVLAAWPAALLPVAGCVSRGAKGGDPTPAEPGGEGDRRTFTLRPIGRVEVTGGAASIRTFDAYAEGLLGLDQWSHAMVFYWFDRNDTPDKRRILRVHPRGNPANPLTGVFACRSPFRPNLVAFTLCRIASIEGSVLRVEGLDAFDGTPVLDLKPYTPADAPSGDVRVPDWARRGPGAGGSGP